jgi:probable phosphoglycerate mutase
VIELLLARHGQTPWHHGNRYAGSSDIGLDDVGRAQAERLATAMAARGVSDLAASTLRRAQDTAKAVTEKTGHTATVLSELREIGFGVAEGRTLAQMREALPGATRAFEADPVKHHWPNGDDPSDRVREATTALSDWAAQCGPRPLAIAHSTMIRLIVCHVLGISLGEYRRRLPRLEPCAVTTLGLSADGTWSLIAYNQSLGDHDVLRAPR